MPTSLATSTRRSNVHTLSDTCSAVPAFFMLVSTPVARRWRLHSTSDVTCLPSLHGRRWARLRIGQLHESGRDGYLSSVALRRGVFRGERSNGWRLGAGPGG